jgi:hypothetical protein
MGCSNGVDIEVRHCSGNVRLTAEDKVAQVTEAEWQQAVISFVRQVEDFYVSCSPKITIDDEYDRKGWHAFWQEWRERRTEPLKNGL